MVAACSWGGGGWEPRWCCCSGRRWLLQGAASSSSCCLCPSPVFILFFAVYSLAVAVLLVVLEQRWLFSFLFFFSCLSPPFCSFTPLFLSFGFFFLLISPLLVSVFASSSISHGAGAVIDDWEDRGSWRWLWWLWQEATVERETERGAAAGTPDKRWFFLNFGPPILLPQSMKIKSIYRRWKRDTLFLLVQNCSPWVNPKASQPSAQSSKDELSVLYRKLAGWVGQFGAVPPALLPQSARTAYTNV